MCINGALRAPIDKRFRGFKARALVALLIYLGPILRGWERLKWRVKEMKSRGRPDQPRSATMQEPRLSWKERAFYLSYWSEKGDEKEALLGGLMRFLTPQKYFVVTDQGWNDWDLKISRGLWSRALVLVCTENHGGEKRLLRVRCAMRLSRLSALLLRALRRGHGGRAHPRRAGRRRGGRAASASPMARSSATTRSSSAVSCTASSRRWREHEGLTPVRPGRDVPRRAAAAVRPA